MSSSMRLRNSLRDTLPLSVHGSSLRSRRNFCAIFPFIFLVCIIPILVMVYDRRMKSDRVLEVRDDDCDVTVVVENVYTLATRENSDKCKWSIDIAHGHAWDIFCDRHNGQIDIYQSHTKQKNTIFASSAIQKEEQAFIKQTPRPFKYVVNVRIIRGLGATCVFTVRND